MGRLDGFLKGGWLGLDDASFTRQDAWDATMDAAEDAASKDETPDPATLPDGAAKGPKFGGMFLPNTRFEITINPGISSREMVARGPNFAIEIEIGFVLSGRLSNGGDGGSGELVPNPG